jgi:hypothetical protein
MALTAAQRCTPHTRQCTLNCEEPDIAPCRSARDNKFSPQPTPYLRTSATLSPKPPLRTVRTNLAEVGFQPGVGPQDSKTVGPIQREHATPAQPTLFRGGKIFTIQPFSRKCPIGHALDIPFENWTSSLRIYMCCRFAFSVSSRGPLTCSDARCLTRCHLGSVSNSCP